MNKEFFFISAKEFPLFPSSAVVIFLSLLAFPSLSSAKVVVAQAPEMHTFTELYFDEEQMIEGAARYPQELDKVAENFTVITAQDIEESNAHTLAEVLKRVPGLFVSFNGEDFGSEASLFIQGSNEAHTHHTVVLLDGVRMNHIDNGVAVTNYIPLQIISRIEIFKGPASSTWGSALGGVINIITKNTGQNAVPEGSVVASYGEANSTDMGMDMAGKIGPLGYYIFSGKQDSDGLKNDRYFSKQSLYGKFLYDFSGRKSLKTTIGYNQPEIKYYDSLQHDISAAANRREFFITATFTKSFSDDLSFSLSGNSKSWKTVQVIDFLGYSGLGEPGESYQKYLWFENSLAMNGHLLWKKDYHSFSIGIEYEKSKMDQTVENGPFLQQLPGVEPSVNAQTANEELFAVYLNDTIDLGKLTVTPGLRYDWHSISDDFLSPSLGATYWFDNETILRMTVARGFAFPALVYIDGGGSLFTPINPELKPEQVWSWQAGIESCTLRYLRFKSSIFYHDLRDAWQRNSQTGTVFNSGKNRRTGIEFEAETIPYHGVSLNGNITYVRETNYSGIGDADILASNISIVYNGPANLRAELGGHFLKCQTGEDLDAEYDEILWDLTVSKRLYSLNHLQIDLFANLHNLFNGSQYWAELVENPDRWAEIGLRFKF